MSEPPEDQKPESARPPRPTLNYETPPARPKDTQRQIMRRQMLGVLLSAGALGAGYGLLMAVAAFDSGFFFLSGWAALVLLLLPLAITFYITLSIALRRRRYDYVIGVVLGPVVLVVAVGLMLLMTCAGRRSNVSPR
jgi:hypothetical protein